VLLGEQYGEQSAQQIATFEKRITTVKILDYGLQSHFPL